MTVVPSYLRLENTMDQAVGFEYTLNNVRLQFGRVMKAVPPNDPKNSNKKYWEYEVQVVSMRGSDFGLEVIPHCRVASVFGGAADYLQYTYRIDDPGAQRAFNVGSQVIVAYMSGDMRAPLIITGFNNPQAPGDNPADGHCLKFEFNGFQFNINDAGEGIATFRGKTQADGALHNSAEEEASGTQLAFQQDGSLTIQTNDGQFIKIDHANKTIEFAADTEWNVVSKGTANIESAQNTTIKSTGLLVGDATDNFIKGTTYRNAENAKNQALQAQLSALSASLSLAAGAITAMTAPMLIPVVGPLTAAPLFTTAGAALTTAVGIVTSMSATIASFEAGAPSYLSVKNKSD